MQLDFGLTRRSSTNAPPLIHRGIAAYEDAFRRRRAAKRHRGTRDTHNFRARALDMKRADPNAKRQELGFPGGEEDGLWEEGFAPFPDLKALVFRVEVDHADEPLALSIPDPAQYGAPQRIVVGHGGLDSQLAEHALP